MYYKVKITSVDYCVEEQDVCEYVDNDPEIEEDSEEYYDAIHAKIEEVKSRLPQELILEVECDRKSLEDVLVDAISEETGWLVNNFTYKILERKFSKHYL